MWLQCCFVQVDAMETSNYYQVEVALPGVRKGTNPPISYAELYQQHTGILVMGWATCASSCSGDNGPP